MERDIERIAGAGRKKRGKVVGGFYIEKNKVQRLTDMAADNFRHAIEFVMKTSPYTRADIMRLDVLTFLKILKECEDGQKKEIERLENSKNG